MVYESSSPPPRAPPPPPARGLAPYVGPKTSNVQEYAHFQTEGHTVHPYNPLVYPWAIEMAVYSVHTLSAPSRRGLVIVDTVSMLQKRSANIWEGVRRPSSLETVR